MKNYYHQWVPKTIEQNILTTIQNNQLIFDGLSFGTSRLSISLHGKIDSDKLCCFKITFPTLVPFKVTPKKYFEKIDKNKIENTNWSFFIIDYSDALDWYHKNGAVFWGEFIAKHYVIVTKTECIEILSTCQPIIETDKVIYEKMHENR
jgi:hypothetical protein